MKVLNSFGPNPRMLRMFLLEKNINVEFVEHDLMAAENRQEKYLGKNPGGQLPALELDNGMVIAETVVICDYLEEINPEPALIGKTGEERAEARMWNRLIIIVKETIISREMDIKTSPITLMTMDD